jgi:hypothetical protein
MPPELTPRVWKTIFMDLSPDAIHPCLPAMGLRRADDVRFAKGLQAIIPAHQAGFAWDEGVERFVDAVFLSARQFGEGYPERLRDWGIFIYPNGSHLQGQLHRWQLIIRRGGLDGARDDGPAPESVRDLRGLLAAYTPLKASALKPLSEWDRRYFEEREEELGFSPFEWVETAARNFRFLSAWNAVSHGPHAPKMDEVYAWGVREAAMLRMPGEMIDPPDGLFRLPDPLKGP